MPFIKRVILSIASLYLIVGLLLFIFQKRFLFHPTTLPQDYVYQFDTNFEEVFLEPEPDIKINAIHFKVDNPQGVILYFHGNARSLKRWGRIVTYFVNYNYDVFVMDYRSFGKSTGELTVETLYSDGQYCYDYLKNQYAEENITIYGRSLGTAIATYVASQNRVKQLILESPFYSIGDVASHRFPMYPVSAILQYELPTYKYIEGVDCGITILHGTDDRIVPFKSGKKLAKKVSNDRLKFIAIENGTHNDLRQFAAYKRAIDSLLKD